MSKKTFYIILIILIGLIIVWLVWYLALKQEKAPISATPGAGFTTPDRIKNNVKIKVISNEPVVSAYLDNSGILRYYDYSGQLWEFSANGSEPFAINQSPIKNASEIIWSKNAKNIVKSGTNQSDASYAVSDPDQKSLFNMKTNVKSAAFSPDGKKIVYQISSNPTSNGLFISDLDGKNQKTLFKDLNLRDIILSWTNANNIAIVSRPSGVTPGSLWFIDIKNSNINKIIDSFFGLEVLFSPDGKNFVYSYTDQNGKNPALAVYENKNNQRILNNVSAITDKCVWANDSTNIYCAIPKSWPDFAVLPDDYYKNIFTTSDDIWKIDAKTGEKTLVFEHIGNISNLAANENENKLFFISKENQFLYILNIE